MLQLPAPFRRPAIVVLACAIALSACGPSGPTPEPTSAPSGPPASAPVSRPPDALVYAEIRSAVEAIRGLRAGASVEPVTIDADQLRTQLEAEFDALQTPEQLQDTEDLLIALGLLPPGASLRQITLDFQGGQVAGYYSPDKDELYVVSRAGGVGPAEEATYAHEYTHQLQDQHVDLNGLGIDDAGESDLALARLALVEGDATSVQGAWMTAHLDAEELGQVLAAALDPAALEALRRAPAYLRDTATFPYQDGLAFVTRLLAEGGYAAVDAAYLDPPDSTEQVLHPDRYLVREAPVRVEVPDGLPAALGSGWSEAARDTLGELILRIWLREAGVTTAKARTASAGWGGDRLVFLRGPGGAVAVLMRTAWDTPADATEFADAAALALDGLPLGGRLRHVPGSNEVDVAIGDVADALLAALGN